MDEFDEESLTSDPDWDSQAQSSEDSDDQCHPVKRRKSSSKDPQKSQKPYFTHRIKDQASQTSTFYHSTKSRSRAQSKVNKRSNLIGTYELDEQYSLDDAIEAAKKENNKNIPEFDESTQGYQVIRDVKGEPIQQVRYHHSRPESRAYQALITVVRAQPEKGKQLNRNRRQLITRVCKGEDCPSLHQELSSHQNSSPRQSSSSHPDASSHRDSSSQQKSSSRQDSSSLTNRSVHLPAGSGSKRNWEDISQRIISIDGWSYRATTDNLKGISQSAVATKNAEQVQRLKSDPVMVGLQKEIHQDLDRFQGNTSSEWMESYQREENIERTNCLPCPPYSGVCFNWPKSDAATIAVPAHRDVLDGLYDSCTVMPISLDPYDESWSPTSYELCFPALRLKIQLGPMDKVIFPSRIYVHFNSGCKRNDPTRASIVFFTHESLLIKLDQKDLFTKKEKDLARKAGMDRRIDAFLDPRNRKAGPSVFASTKGRPSRKQKRKAIRRGHCGSAQGSVNADIREGRSL